MSAHPAKVSYMSQPKGFQDKVSLIWSIADILRGDFKPHEYGQTMLPFVVLRRLECSLEKSKDQVIAKAKSLEGKIKDLDTILKKESGHSFYNTSPLSLSRILQDPNKVSSNLNSYIRSFSPSASEVLDKYGFPEKIKKLDEQGLLYQMVGKFADLDLSEESVSNEAMGYVFEELLRKFSEMANETAGEHYTPREVIRLMVNLLFIEDEKALSAQKPVRTIYDPACGTGGMLSVAEEYLHELNPNIDLNVFGQELNPETWAIARSDLMIKGQDPTRITLGNSLTHEDGHSDRKFDYCISNPPYGVDWKKYAEPIQSEYKNLGLKGRYGAGLPPVDDGSLLFLQHMINKMKTLAKGTSADSNDGGSRIAVILSGTPMYSGQAGSGESEIRKWILENDFLEGIVALPDQMFYNTPIGTYVWILTNRKNSSLKNKIKFVDGRSFGSKKKRSLGDKRKELLPDALEEITRLYSEAGTSKGSEYSKLLTRDEFIYQRITIEQPLRCRWVLDSTYELLADYVDKKMTTKLLTFSSESEVLDYLKSLGVPTKISKEIIKNSRVIDPKAPKIEGKKGIEPDSKLRDQENLPVPAGYLDLDPQSRANALQEIADEYLKIEVNHYLKDAWIDHSRTKLGAEISFTRQFFDLKLPRKAEVIDDALRKSTSKLVAALKELL